MKKQNITIKNILKIQIFNNFSHIFKTHLTIINDWIVKNKQLKKDEIFFNIIMEEKTYIKTKFQAFANFAITKSNLKSKKRAIKEKKSLLNSQSIKNLAISI